MHSSDQSAANNHVGASAPDSGTAGPPSRAQIVRLLQEAARQYPAELVQPQLSDIPRIAFNISLVTSRRGENVRLCDLGGGIGLFSVGCAAVGMHAVLVDDFSDSVNERFGAVPNTVHSKYRVQVISSDLDQRNLQFPHESLDVVTTFDSMEHWHHSPKKLFSNVMQWLKPGGLFVLGVPNCVNLRKRLTVPFGNGKWSRMADWYEVERFRGHVREPDTDDLRYIARDMGLVDIEIIGRNWLGYVSRFGWVRALTPMFDIPLRALPSLCSDIYLVGAKPLDQPRHTSTDRLR